MVHETELAASYRLVGDKLKGLSDFRVEDLVSSRSLFTPESLLAGDPRPKELEVYALLSGIAFPDLFARALASVQDRLSSVIGNALHYWVTPANLGVEYCVFKWPADRWDPENLAPAKSALEALQAPVFDFHIKGIQIHPDGCVVAKGFDENGTLFSIREQMKAALPFLPAKQSGWAHVPLGRILEPLGTDRFSKLSAVMEGLSEVSITQTQLTSIKLVHETRWYMEEKVVLNEYPLRRVYEEGLV